MRKKIISEEKYEAVRQILRGEISQRYAAEMLAVKIPYSFSLSS